MPKAQKVVSDNRKIVYPENINPWIKTIPVCDATNCPPDLVDMMILGPKIVEEILYKYYNNGYHC